MSVLMFHGQNRVSTAFPQSASLAAYLRFNGNANDATLNANNLTATGVTYSSANALSGQNVGTFSGNALGNNPTNGSAFSLYTATPTARTWSYSLWFRPTTASAFEGLIFWSDASMNIGSGLALNTGNLVAYCSNANVNLGAYVQNAWNHVVARYNGTNLRVVLNGGTAQTITTAMSAGWSTRFELGTYDRRATSNFTGVLDEFAWWNNTALSDAEMAQLWNGGAGVFY